jgi:hypothetical protein
MPPKAAHAHSLQPIVDSHEQRINLMAETIHTTDTRLAVVESRVGQLVDKVSTVDGKMDSQTAQLDALLAVKKKRADRWGMLKTGAWAVFLVFLGGLVRHLLG